MSHEIVGANMSNSTAQRVYDEHVSSVEEALPDCTCDHSASDVIVDQSCPVHGKKPQCEAAPESRQLELTIDRARKSSVITLELMEQIIRLYASEIDKANALIHKLMVQQSPDFNVKLLELLIRIKGVLYRHQSRNQVRLLIQEIDEFYEQLPHHGKD